jgi:hypothetical protein
VGHARVGEVSKAGKGGVLIGASVRGDTRNAKRVRQVSCAFEGRRNEREAHR